jgi:ribosomal protein S12 methylthiotransferase accessory factor
MSQDAVAFREGTQRACAPEQTWARVEPLLSQAGVTRVADLTWLDEYGIPTWQAVRPASWTLSVSQGKGVSDIAAKVSAVMESLEMWHAEAVPVDVRAAAADLPLGYDPRRLPLADGSLYHDWMVLDWVAGVRVRTGEPSWLPHQMLQLDDRPTDGYLPPLFQATSTGLASGNTWNEATLHGLLEVLERESLCANDDKPRRRLDLDTVTDPTCRDVLGKLDRSGTDVVVHDMTAADQVPCYAASLRSTDVAVAFFGSGAHLSPAIALSRALTEAAQSRATCISGAREDIDPGVYRALGGLLPVPAGFDPGPEETVEFRRQQRPSVSISADLAVVADVAAALLHDEPIVVRFDRGIGLPVVRVAVPGARRDETFTHRRPDAAQEGR